MLDQDVLNQVATKIFGGDRSATVAWICRTNDHLTLALFGGGTSSPEPIIPMTRPRGRPAKNAVAAAESTNTSGEKLKRQRGVPGPGAKIFARLQKRGFITQQQVDAMGEKLWPGQPQYAAAETSRWIRFGKARKENNTYFLIVPTETTSTTETTQQQAIAA